MTRKELLDEAINKVMAEINRPTSSEYFVGTVYTMLKNRALLEQQHESEMRLFNFEVLGENLFRLLLHWSDSGLAKEIAEAIAKAKPNVVEFFEALPKLLG